MAEEQTKGRDPEALSYLDLPDEEDAPGYVNGTTTASNTTKTLDVDDGDDDDDDNYGNETSQNVVYAQANPPFEIPTVKAGLASIGLLLGFIFVFVELGGDRKINQTLAIAIWMATLWLTELIPAVVTAFLPMFIFPFFGIISANDVAKGTSCLEEAKNVKFDFAVDECDLFSTQLPRFMHIPRFIISEFLLKFRRGPFRISLVLGRILDQPELALLEWFLGGHDH